MSFTPEEAVQIKTDIEVLKNSTEKVFNALAENTEEIKEGNKLTHTLIRKIDENDIRRDYEAKERQDDRDQVEKLHNKISETNSRIDNYIDNIAPTIARVKAKHESVDNFKKSMGTTGGKMTMTMIVTAFALFVAYVFGIELSFLN